MKSKNIVNILSDNLFDKLDQESLQKDSPLSARMRPQNLSEYVGQQHILAEGKLLPRAIKADCLSSIILYGPPGTGKTSLAHCIKQETESYFERINAVSANVDDLRKIIAGAQNRRLTAKRKTVLFIDEIHRFNKAQQDVLMPDLEDGNLILIGATVFNPFFSLISPLISRSMVFELKPLDKKDIVEILTKALGSKKRGLGEFNIKADKNAIEFLAEVSNGDARKVLNALEIGCLTAPKDKNGHLHFTLEVAEESIQKKQVVYDKDGDEHYDTASAFIKSMRGSDPDAAIYWMAKMIYAGEDPRFIARRICICAAEDVGNADPQALILANAALQVSEFIGLPEARIPLAQAAIYVATAPKSNASYMAIDNALSDVKNKKTQAVPNHLKDAHYKGAKKLDHGKDYKYAHDYENHYVKQEYMPEQTQYYKPTDMGQEKEIKQRLSKNQ
ncbi:MAG: replication-associated recombination protein A [Candidatus Zapsychrus exili]|nr:replication-associated recombination protein A [Candidatus Zapsychrus exili]